MSTPEGILLVGPTGSGKTPLGDMLEQTGLRGQRCMHFDFGAGLRALAKMETPSGEFDECDIAVARDSISNGTLLERKNFRVAERILRSFLVRNGAERDDAVILNGLPRHADQFDIVTPLVRTSAVIQLVCSPETVLERIQRNSGGDRTHRTDDARDKVQRRLEIYEKRTLPLIGYCIERDMQIHRIEVGTHTTAEDCVREMGPCPTKLFQHSRDEG